MEPTTVVTTFVGAEGAVVSVAGGSGTVTDALLLAADTLPAPSTAANDRCRFRASGCCRFKGIEHGGDHEAVAGHTVAGDAHVVCPPGPRPIQSAIEHATEGHLSILATETTNVIAGIDTHADTHHVAVINEYGRPLADREFLAVGSGYRKIVEFITSYGSVTAGGGV